MSRDVSEAQLVGRRGGGTLPYSFLKNEKKKLEGFVQCVVDEMFIETPLF